MTQSPFGFGLREPRIGYLCKTIDDACAYACALHLVQMK